VTRIQKLPKEGQKEAFKASTFMILLSIVGIIGTVSLACLVWYLVADWKNAEHLLEKERGDLDRPSPVVGVVADYLLSAKEISPSAVRAKSAKNMEGFTEVNFKVEVALNKLELAFNKVEAALKKLNETLEKVGKSKKETWKKTNQSIDLLEAISASISKNKASLKAISSLNEEGKKKTEADKEKGKQNQFETAYSNEVSILTDLIKQLKLKTDDLEKRREADLLALEQVHRPEDRRGISKLWITLAVILSGILPLFLAWSTYRIVARPIHLLATAAARSLDEDKPFEMKETGPAEVRSLTRRLGSLVQGLEERVLKRTEQLHTKAVELEQEMEQRKELEGQLVFAQKMEAVGQLAAGIAHEVNTPSQYVCDNLRFLKEAVDDLLAAVAPSGGEGETTEKPDPEDLEFLCENAPGAVDEALQGMERITTIVKSMKNFAYRDAASEKKPQNLNQAIEATTVVASNEWKYHADLQTDLDPNLPSVPCNIGEINQVVLNLIVNAAHAIRDAKLDSEKGVIAISTKQYDDFVVITIQDNGGGIPEEVQAKVFEPFFTTKEVGVGTGQGLAIAHNVITKSHGGHLWFETESGVGTTFFIRLPLQAVQETAEAEVSEADSEAELETDSQPA